HSHAVEKWQDYYDCTGFFFKLSKPNLMQLLMLFSFLVVLLPGTSSISEKVISSSITYSKVYLVTDEDYEELKDEVGVPSNYVQLSLCETNSQDIIEDIEDGTSTAFTKGTLLPWC